MIRGILERVTTDDVATLLGEDASAGATILYVEDLDVLSLGGGTLRLTAPDDTTTVLEYNVGLDDIGAVELAEPLADDWPDITEVTAEPAQQERRAWVVTEENTPALECYVAHNLKPATVLADQVFDNGSGPTVVCDLVGGRWTLVDIIGDPGLVDGAAIDPDSTVPPAALTDGLPPDDAPTGLVAEPFAVGGVQVRWTRLTPEQNPDPVTYRVHASLTSPVPEDGSALVTSTTSDRASVTSVGGTALALAAATPVYVKVQSSDADGLGPFSSEVSATTRIGDESISAFFRIEARQISAGEFDAEYLKVRKKLLIGDYVVDDGETSTRTYYDDVNHTIPGTTIGPFRSIWRGIVDALDATIKRLRITGASFIGAGGSLTLESGVSDPTDQADLAPGLDTRAWPAVPTGFRERGISWDATDSVWLRLLVSTSSSINGKCRVEKIPPTWTTTDGAVPYVTLGDVIGIGEDDMNSVVRVGTSYFVMVFDDYYNPARWYVGKFAAATGAFVALSANYYDYVDGRPAIGLDANGTGLLIPHVYTNGTRRLRMATIIPSDLSQFYNGDYITPWAGSGQFVGAISRSGSDLFSFAPAFYQLAMMTSTRVLAFDQASDGSVVAKPDHDIVLDSDVARGGVGFRPGALYGWHSHAEGGTLGRYSRYRQTTSGEGMFIGYDGRDGTSTTKRSPLNVAVVPNHRFLLVALPKAPPLAPQSRVYGYIGTAPPGSDTSLKQRLETLTARTMLIDPSVAGGANTPSATNTYPAGSPGLIQSLSGLTRLGGDDDTRVATPTLAGQAANKGYVDAAVAHSDTGWLPCTPLGSYSVSGGTPGALHARMVDGTVYLRGGATGSFTAGTLNSVAQLPAGITPPSTTPHRGAVFGTGVRGTGFEITTAGVIQAGPILGTSGTVTWVAVATKYPVG